MARRGARSAALALCLAAAGPAAATEPGEALFVLGARPGAAPPRAMAAGGAALPASALPCAGCHGADGAGGRAEAGVRPPPVRWSALSRSTPERPAYDEAALLRTVAQGVAAGGRALDPAMPRYALTSEDGRALVAWLRALDLPREAPGVAEDRVRFGLLLPPGPRGEAFADAFAAALDAAAPSGVFGRRIERVAATPAGDPAGAVKALLAEGVLALVSALPEEANAAALAEAGAARAPVLSVRAAAEAAPLGFALLPGAVEEGVALLRAVPEPGRAVIFAGNDAAEARLAERIAERVGALAAGAEPPVVRSAELRAAAASEGAAAAVLMLAPAAELAEAVAPLRDIAVPVLVVGSRGGLAAPAAAAALGRPVLVGLGVPVDTGSGVALARFRASGAAARAGLTGRLGHAMGEVVVEALRRGGRGVTRDKLASAFAGPPFDTGALPPLRLSGGARGGGGEAVQLFQVDGASRLRPGPAAVTAGTD